MTQSLVACGDHTMKDIKGIIASIAADVEQALLSVKSTRGFDDVRTRFLGKKGAITDLMAEIKNLSLEEKKEFGPLIIALKDQTTSRIADQQKEFAEEAAKAEAVKKQNFDVTSYTPNKRCGHLHPYTQTIEEIQNIFLTMGFEIWDGPERETDFYNFTALNIPENHPARDMHDTFWLSDPGFLMRTHTSTIQIHALQEAVKNGRLPIAGIAPGRCYRHEAVDASHDFMFMQCEGLYVDKNVTISHLFGTLQTFLKQFFKKESLDIRIRPGFFPFVEPGFEIDMRCPFCTAGCSVCKKTTWIEVCPGGLIHPNVLRAVGIDPEEYSGFAFGFGLTRTVMLKYNIDDIRLLYGGKVKFLEQF